MLVTSPEEYLGGGFKTLGMIIQFDSFFSDVLKLVALNQILQTIPTAGNKDTTFSS